MIEDQGASRDLRSDASGQGSGAIGYLLPTPGASYTMNWEGSPADVELWGVYGPACFPTVFRCKLRDYADGSRAIWGWSFYEGEPGYRTLGQNKDWAERNGLRLFLTAADAFLSIYEEFQPPVQQTERPDPG